jgi:hypothetical protein
MGTTIKRRQFRRPSDDDIVDISSGHWIAEAQVLFETITEPADRKLGSVEWGVVPPEFIWQSAHSLKAPWRPGILYERVTVGADRKTFPRLT